MSLQGYRFILLGRGRGDRVDDLVWYYPEPIAATQEIKSHLCFFNEKVDLEVDGEAQERPRTQWS